MATAPSNGAGWPASWRGLPAGVIAAGLALAGFGLLGAETTRLLGCGLLLAAGVLSIVAWGGVSPYPAFGSQDSTASPTMPDAGRRRLALAGIMVAGGLLAMADLWFLAQPDVTFGLAGLLWLLSLAMLLGSVSAWPRPRADADIAPAPPAWSRSEIMGIAGLVALALLLRIWDLTNIPYNIYPDEIMTGTVATQAYIGGTNPPVFSTLWGGIDLPALWFLLVAGSLKIGGVTLAILRLPAALFGTASIIPFYGLVRQVWGRAAAIAGSAILAFSASDVHYSRVTLNNILPQFFWAACFFFLLRGLRYRRPLDWTLAGVFGGISEYGYYGTRLLPFVLIAFFGYLLLVHWRQARTMIGYFALVAVGYIVGFGPLLAYYFLHPSTYLGRPTGTQILSHIVSSWPNLGEMMAVAWPTLAETLLGINTHPSQDLVYFAPLLLAGEAALLVLGTALLIRQWRHPASFLLLLSGWGALVGGGVLVLYSAPPFLAHLTPGFPAIYVAIAIPFYAISRLVKGAVTVPRLAGGKIPALRVPYFAIIMGLVLLVMGILDWSFYFQHYYADRRALNVRLQRPQMDYAIQTAQSRWQATLGTHYQVYIVGHTLQYYSDTTTAYLVSAPPVVHIQNPPADLPAQAPPGHGMAFVFYADTIQYRDLIAQNYPGGVSGETDSPYGQPLFYSYVLPLSPSP